MVPKVQNLLEALLWEEIATTLPRFPNMCTCEQCRLDIYTLSLNLLPPVYVTGRRYNNDLKTSIQGKYLHTMHEAIGRAVARVRENPRPDCLSRKGFWISPDAPVKVSDGLVPHHLQAGLAEASENRQPEAPLPPWESAQPKPPTAPVLTPRSVKYSQIPSTRRRY